MRNLKTRMGLRIGWALALALACVAVAPLAGALGAPAGGWLAAQEPKCTDKSKSCDERDRERDRRELERLRRQIERQIEQALKTLDNEEESIDSRTLRITREQLTQAIRALEVTRLRLEAQEAADADADGARRRQAVSRGLGEGDSRTRVRVRTPQPAQPPQPPQPPQPAPRTGWLGVSLSSAGDAIGTVDGRRMFQFRGYPIVVAVEPSSPARRAGLLAGDVLLALDGIDLKRSAVPLDDLLRAGNRLPVRLRRDGETRDVTIIVGRREQSYEVATPAPAPRREPEVVVIPKPHSNPAISPRSPERPPALVPFTAYPTTTTPIAGSELTRISGDMGDYFGVDAGLLVLGVAPGTPASRAGLRTGDVIVAANGEEIESVRELSEVIAGDGTRRPVKLDVVRKKERLTLTLR